MYMKRRSKRKKRACGKKNQRDRLTEKRHSERERVIPRNTQTRTNNHVADSEMENV